jgi:prepilin-type processing-associated H-X9-DG protein
LTESTATPDVVVLYEPLSNHTNEGTNVLFGDFHVEWMKNADAQSIQAQQAAGKKVIRLTTSP